MILPEDFKALEQAERARGDKTFSFAKWKVELAVRCDLDAIPFFHWFKNCEKTQSGVMTILCFPNDKAAEMANGKYSPALRHHFTMYKCVGRKS